jgi:hypothetical protein
VAVRDLLWQLPRVLLLVGCMHGTGSLLGREAELWWFFTAMARVQLYSAALIVDCMLRVLHMHWCVTAAVLCTMLMPVHAYVMM